MFIRSVGLVALSLGLAGFALPDNSIPVQVRQDRQQEQQEEQRKRKPDTHDFMMVKLDMVREVVLGLSSANFEKIAKSAQELMLLSHEADWNVETTPTYLKMSSEFRASAERLRDTATEKNLDGSTIAYFEVTLSCVRCHKYIRGN